MRFRSNLHVLFAAAVLVCSVALYGCPKRPEVMQAAPAPAGPAGAMVPGAPGASPAQPRAGETPVTRPATPGETPVKPGAAGPAGAAGAAGAAAQPGVPGASPLKDVFFDYDKAMVRDDQKAALNDNVGWLKVNIRAKLLVEGHCDERGTAEYNLALGERRAVAARTYLVSLGVPADRLHIVTYGKEFPFDPGHDEAAWAKNRRAHFVITAK
jgi:peptidoglycan-associated lipoprotein